MESCWLPVPGALWANVFALFYRAFRGDRRRRSSRRTVSKSVEDGPVLSFLFVLLSSYPSLAFSLSRDFDRTPGGTRGGILFFFLRLCATTHPTPQPPRVFSLFPPRSSQPSLLLYLLALVRSSLSFFFPLFPPLSFASFFFCLFFE